MKTCHEYWQLQCAADNPLRNRSSCLHAPPWKLIQIEPTSGGIGYVNRFPIGIRVFTRIRFSSSRSWTGLNTWCKRKIENGRRLQHLAGTRVEPASNCEYALISELRLITRDSMVPNFSFLQWSETYRSREEQSARTNHTAGKCRRIVKAPLSDACNCTVGSIKTAAFMAMHSLTPHFN